MLNVYVRKDYHLRTHLYVFFYILDGCNDLKDPDDPDDKLSIL